MGLWLAGLLLEGPLAAQEELEIRFLDVGQGDAVLVREGPRTALLDAGPSRDVVGRLRALGVDSIGLALASHNHADHIGGFRGVLRDLPVRFYLDNGHPATTLTQRDVLELVRDRGIAYLAPVRRTVRLGETSLEILPPPPGMGEGQNDRSLVVLIRKGSFRALLSGDSERREIGALLALHDLPDVDVLKGAHHGSRDAVTRDWLETLRPEVVVIGVGAGNPFGHPHPEALEAYRAQGARVLRTDRDGEVVVFVSAEGCYRVGTAADVGEGDGPERPGCRICRKGVACGDSCISRRHTCRKPPECPCDG